MVTHRASRVQTDYMAVAWRTIRLFIRWFVRLSIGALFIAPVLWMLSTSLKLSGSEFEFPPRWIPSPVVLGNYPQAVRSIPTGIYLRNSLAVACFNVVATCVISCMVAFGFARLRFPGRDQLFMVVLSTMMLPYVVTLVPRFILFRNLGWIDTLLPLMIPSLGGSPFYIFLFRQFMLTLPMDLDEAAKVDGASNWMIWFRITLPLCGPVLATTAIFTFIGAWNDFMGPMIYLHTMSKLTLAVGLRMFYSMQRGTQWNLMMALGSLMSLPIILIFLFCQRYFMRGIVMTGMGGR